MLNDLGSIKHTVNCLMYKKLLDLLVFVFSIAPITLLSVYLISAASMRYPTEAEINEVLTLGIYTVMPAGIITWVFTSGEVVVLFEDGEHQMDSEDMEVIND